MSRSLKPILTGIWGLLLVPLIAAILEKRLEENLFSDPNAPATTVFSNLVVVGHQLWFQFVLVFFTGIVLGFSLDWLARKSDQKKLPNSEVSVQNFALCQIPSRFGPHRRNGRTMCVISNLKS